jgi:hypothetical protein
MDINFLGYNFKISNKKSFLKNIGDIIFGMLPFLSRIDSKLANKIIYYLHMTEPLTGITNNELDNLFWGIDENILKCMIYFTDNYVVEDIEFLYKIYSEYPYVFSSLIKLCENKYYFNKSTFKKDINYFNKFISIINDIPNDYPCNPENIKKIAKYCFSFKDNFSLQNLNKYIIFCEIREEDISFFESESYFEELLKLEEFDSFGFIHSSHFKNYNFENEKKNEIIFKKTFRNNCDENNYFECYDKMNMESFQTASNVFEFEENKNYFWFKNKKYNHKIFNELNLCGTKNKTILDYGRENLLVFNEIVLEMDDLFSLRKNLNKDFFDRYEGIVELKSEKTNPGIYIFNFVSRPVNENKNLYFYLYKILGVSKYKNKYLKTTRCLEDEDIADWKTDEILEAYYSDRIELELSDIKIYEDKYVFRENEYKHYGNEKKCGVCLETFETYNNFKVFKCGHSLCEDCFSRVKKCSLH